MHSTNPTRRAFLYSACAAGAALALGGTLFPLLCEASPSSLARQTPQGAEQQTKLLMGTMLTLTAVSSEPQRAEEAFARAFAEAERLVAIFDRRNATGALGVLNAQGSIADVPQELALVLRHSGQIGRDTKDSFNPAVAPLVDLLAEAAKAGKPLPDHRDDAFRQALALSAPGGIDSTGTGLRLARTEMRLTLDGIAKGYIADRVSAVLAQCGLGNHMVNAGGDIRVSGRSVAGKAWNIGIRNPDNAARPVALASLTSGAIATSGGYEHSFDKGRNQHHLLSHTTGKSALAVSVTVKAQNAMQADALATALSMLPPVEALRMADSRPDTACLIVTQNGQILQNARWS